MDWHEVFRINPIDYTLEWIDSPFYEVPAGTKAGTISKRGYWKTKYKGKMYFNHRIIYELVYGKLSPTCAIDHIDGNTLNNNPVNLRLATTSQNQWNAKKRSDNSTGVKGLTIRYELGKSYWYAQIQANRIKYTARFQFNAIDKQAAINWLKEMRSKLHGKFANHGEYCAT